MCPCWFTCLWVTAGPDVTLLCLHVDLSLCNSIDTEEINLRIPEPMFSNFLYVNRTFDVRHCSKAIATGRWNVINPDRWSVMGLCDRRQCCKAIKWFRRNRSSWNTYQQHCLTKSIYSGNGLNTENRNLDCLTRKHFVAHNKEPCGKHIIDYVY